MLRGVVDTQYYPQNWRSLLNIPRLLVSLLVQLPGTDVVMLNSSRGGTRYLAPMVSFLTGMLGKPFVFRPFGGDMKDYTADYGRLQRWLFQKTVLKAEVLFLQTQALMAYYADSGGNTVQMPTCRKSPPGELTQKKQPFRKRFVFLGHVKESKGIDEIIAVAGQLPEDYTLHIYGPITQFKYRQQFRKNKPIYRGLLKPQDILPTLSNYDVLVLPTYYEGEGYPGVIIEAFSLGLPVITTRWKAIPELVKDGETGLLISPRSSEELYSAIKTFNRENYNGFSLKARDYFENYLEEEVVLGKTLEAILNLKK